MILSANQNKSIFWLFAGLFIAFLLLVVFTGEYFWIFFPVGIAISYFGWQNIGIPFFLLLATLPFSAEYHFTPELGTDIPDEALMLVTAGLSFFYVIYKRATVTKDHRHSTLLFFLTAALAWIFTTALFSTNQLISFKFFLAKCWYIGAFVVAPLILFRKKEAIKTAGVILALSMFIVTSIILFRHAFYDFRFEDINNAVQPLFRNHVNYSAMLVCLIPVFFAWYQLSNSKKAKSFLVVAIITLFIALFFSYSRGAWLALLAGLAAYWLIQKRLLFLSFIAAIIISLVSLFWMKSNNRYLKYAPDFNTTIFHKDFREHLIATYRLKDVSTEERFYRWIAGVRMIKDNWLTGYGPNTFYYNYKPYAIPAFKTWVSDNKEHSTVHNYFLLLAIEQGIPGLIFFLLLIGGMLYYAQRLYHRTNDSFYKIVAATAGAIVAMLIVLNSLSDLIETDKVGSIFFLCLSVLIAAGRNVNLTITNKNNGMESVSE